MSHLITRTQGIRLMGSSCGYLVKFCLSGFWSNYSKWVSLWLMLADHDPRSESWPLGTMMAANYLSWVSSWLVASLYGLYNEPLYDKKLNLLLIFVLSLKFNLRDFWGVTLLGSFIVNWISLSLYFIFSFFFIVQNFELVFRFVDL